MPDTLLATRPDVSNVITNLVESEFDDFWSIAERELSFACGVDAPIDRFDPSLFEFAMADLARRRAARALLLFECAACGNEVGNEVRRCPKCGSGSITPTTVSSPSHCRGRSRERAGGVQELASFSEVRDLYNELHPEDRLGRTRFFVVCKRAEEKLVAGLMNLGIDEGVLQ